MVKLTPLAEESVRVSKLKARSEPEQETAHGSRRLPGSKASQFVASDEGEKKEDDLAGRNRRHPSTGGTRRDAGCGLDQAQNRDDTLRPSCRALNAPMCRSVHAADG